MARRDHIRDEINAAFWAFHERHPEVYALFDRFTRELIKAGYQHGSAKAVCERLRWETSFQSEGPVKINNNFTSRYARLWEYHNPEHRGFFRTRALNPTSSNAVNLPADERKGAPRA